MAKEDSKLPSEAIMRYCTGRAKSQGEIVAHVKSLGFDTRVVEGILHTLTRRQVLIMVDDKYILDSSFSTWHIYKQSTDGFRTLYRRWNGKKWEYRGRGDRYLGSFGERRFEKELKKGLHPEAYGH